MSATDGIANGSEPAVPGIGDRAPAFDLPLAGGGRISGAALLGRPFVLWFYPKAGTSACTDEAIAFDAAAAGAPGLVLLGVSRDPVRAIERFAGRHELSVPLASDPDGVAAAAFGCWKQRSMYGRRYMGVERSTFLVDADGIIRGAWRKVSVPGHVAAVMAAAATLEARPQP